MENFKEYLDMAMKFHGHKCPAMPLGLRAGFSAMRALGVERAKDKELRVWSETGKGHAAGCFLDGIMAATGCTYGKANIEKLYYSKMAFTLIDTKSGRAVRVSLDPDFFSEKALKSPFVQKRKAGVPPQDIPPEITDPIVERVLTIPEDEFLNVGEIENVEVGRAKGLFEVKRCEICGEVAFINKVRLTPDGKLACIPCSGYGE